MNNLKTLKDMKGFQDTDTLHVIRGIFPYAITTYDLRTEAIKWVEELRLVASEFHPHDKNFSHDDWLKRLSAVVGHEIEDLADDYFYDDVWVYGFIHGLMIFHNISEDELK